MTRLNVGKLELIRVECPYGCGKIKVRSEAGVGIVYDDHKNSHPRSVRCGASGTLLTPEHRAIVNSRLQDDTP